MGPASLLWSRTAPNDSGCSAGLEAWKQVVSTADGQHNLPFCLAFSCSKIPLRVWALGTPIVQMKKLRNADFVPWPDPHSQQVAEPGWKHRPWGMPTPILDTVTCCHCARLRWYECLVQPLELGARGGAHGLCSCLLTCLPASWGDARTLHSSQEDTSSSNANGVFGSWVS